MTENIECHSIDWAPPGLDVGLPRLTSEISTFSKKDAVELERSLLSSLCYHWHVPSTNPWAGHLLKCRSCALEGVTLHKDLTAHNANDAETTPDHFELPLKWHDFGLLGDVDGDTFAGDREAVADMVKRYTLAYQLQSDIVAHLHTDQLVWRHLLTEPENEHVSIQELWKMHESQLFFQGSYATLERQSIWQAAVLEVMGRNMMIMTHWLINPRN